MRVVREIVARDARVRWCASRTRPWARAEQHGRGRAHNARPPRPRHAAVARGYHSDQLEVQKKFSPSPSRGRAGPNSVVLSRGTQ